MPTWYVAYRRGRDIAMQVSEGREAAIGSACAFLNRGLDVTEVGPTAGSSAQRLDATAIREIHQLRESAGTNNMMARVNGDRAPGASAEGGGPNSRRRRRQGIASPLLDPPARRSSTPAP
jgi:hypothetical protein